MTLRRTSPGCWTRSCRNRLSNWNAGEHEEKPWRWYSSGEHSALGKPDMNRAGALGILSLFGWLAFTSQTFWRKTAREATLIPPLQQPQMPPLPPFGEPQIFRVTRSMTNVFSGPACGPIGIGARDGRAVRLSTLTNRSVDAEEHKLRGHYLGTNHCPRHSDERRGIARSPTSLCKEPRN